MRNITFAFLVAELLDVLTTLIGMELGFVELNPIGRIGVAWVMPLKLLAIIVVALVLQTVPPRKIYWTVPAVAGLIVLWNVLNIVLYYI